uniref:Aquaporin-9 n=2 Tax=Panagrellus redivivus TaxID=6233 RepID=A0A7E4VUA5_PANRE
MVGRLRSVDSGSISGGNVTCDSSLFDSVPTVVPRYDPDKVPTLDERDKMTTYDSIPDRLRHRFKIRNELIRNVLCEFICTTALIFGGDSIVACFILGRGKYGEWIGISIGWGLALIMAAQLGFRTSGAHMNPAVSLYVYTFGLLSLPHMFIYFAAQIAGGFMGAALTFIIYYDAINFFDGGTRAVIGPRATAGIFCTFPQDYLTVLGGFVDQVFATAVLCFFVAMVTDRRNKIPQWAQPLLIGATLMLIGMAWGMNCGYALNPARDLGPRLFTLVAGYGWKVFSIRNYTWFWIPVIGPMLGGPIGAWAYQLLIGFHIPSELDEIEDEIRRLTEVKTGHQTVTLQDRDTPQPVLHNVSNATNNESRVV